MSKSQKTEARFIDTPNGELFTVYHEPEGSLVRSSAVLLLYSGEQEYKMVHWAFRHLAAQLAKQGWPVLRFDYTATGDSEGETGAGNLNLWTDDAVAAVQYLKVRSNCLHVQVVGVRLGAFVAARLSRSVPMLNTVLWDPPTSGSAYLADLTRLEAGQRAIDRFHKVRVPTTRSDDIAFPFGFPLAKGARALIAAFNWQQEPVASSFCHTVVTLDRGHAGPAHARLTKVDEELGWGDSSKTQDALLAPRSIKAIIGLIGGPANA